MLKEYREFMARGNVIDMAVGVVVGAAFGAIVRSFVSDVIMPPIGLVLGKVDFSNLFVVLREGRVPMPYPSLTAAQNSGAVTVNIGVFINTIISFLLIGWATFLLVKAVNQLRRTRAASLAAATTRECPRCCSTIPVKATRCPHCTSELGHDVA
jgi:large conductance mechanosensitive channel